MTWLVYGLLANRDTDHDLRFIAPSDHPLDIVDQHQDTYEAFMAFPQDTADQLEPGTRTAIAPVAAAFGLRARWSNAAEKAGRS